MNDEKKVNLEELGQYVTDTVYDILQNLFENEKEIKESFETDDPEWEKALDRFLEFYKKDKMAALTGMIISSIVTSDLFIEIIEGEEGEHEHHDHE